MAFESLINQDRLIAHRNGIVKLSFFIVYKPQIQPGIKLGGICFVGEREDFPEIGNAFVIIVKVVDINRAQWNDSCASSRDVSQICQWMCPLVKVEVDLTISLQLIRSGRAKISQTYEFIVFHMKNEAPSGMFFTWIN